ncbi:FecR domain-containing protein [Maridesulfovibrio sp. FT414]|uniref:FecR domain-containing protein n=1 Tax=Maridesulfovibrio sp. FT414 TaxID=2979469 RepID=UPI003D800867
MSPETIHTQSSIGVVLEATGDVYLRSGEGMRQVEAGAPVYRGEELVTGHGSSAEIRFADDSLLSQGADSSIHLNDYVYEETDGTASELFFKMGHGTFRMVTGKIAETNPERFKIGSPLATIGIRGTITVHEIGADGEKHGVEEIHSGKALLIQSIDGSVRQISTPQSIVDVASTGIMGSVRSMTTQEFETFRDIAPAAIQQEQEIRDQQNDNGDDQQDSDRQGDENAQGDAADSEEGDGTQATGEEGTDAIDGADTGVSGMADVVETVMQAAVTEGMALADAEMQNGEFVGADEFFDAAEFDMGDFSTTDFEVMALDAGTGIDVLAGLAGLDAASADTDFFESTFGDLLDGTADDPVQQVFNEVLQGTDLTGELTGDLLDSSFVDVLPTADDPVSDTATDDDILDLLDTADTTLPADTVVESAVAEAANTLTLETGTIGDDVWRGSSQSDYYDGLAGNDYIDGRPGDDTLLGGEGNDTLDGGNGSDTLFGGDGNDTLIGGQGPDYIDGGDGIDTIAFGTSSGVYVSLMSDTESGSVGEDIVLNVENIIGTSGGDTLYGCDGSNVINGGSGHDIIGGNGGDDTLFGNLGSDTLTGGSGSDVFYYTALAEGGDTVSDFSSVDDDFLFSCTDFNNQAKFKIVGGDYGGTDNLDGDNGSLDTSEYFVFDGSGRLWYDANGEGAGGVTLIAVVEGQSVTSSDITFEGGCCMD